MRAGARWPRIKAALTPAEWRRAGALAAAVVGLHVVGFAILLLAVVPHHYDLGDERGRSGSGLGITAYTLGLRHAFDADHIGAIDNTTRKLMGEGQRPLSVGFFFSLGHSTIVFALGRPRRGRRARAQRRGAGRRLDAAPGDGARRPARLRVVPAPHRPAQPADPARRPAHLPAMRRGALRRGRARGAARPARVHERASTAARRAPIAQAVADVPARAVCSAWASTPRPRSRCSSSPARGAAGGLPFYAILCLPILFAAGMSLLRHDRRRVHELRLRLGVLAAGPQGLLQHHRHRAVGRGRARRRDDRAALRARRAARPQRRRRGTSSPAWTSTSSATRSSACSSSTWAVALAVWRFGRIEERWSAGLQEL